jgi:hypothetical protein
VVTASRHVFLNLAISSTKINLHTVPAIEDFKMATTTQIRLRGRPAHTQGPTYLSYTPDGTKLVTVGSNNTTRVYKTGFDGEPTNIDDCQEQNMAVDSTVSILC